MELSKTELNIHNTIVNKIPKWSCFKKLPPTGHAQYSLVIKAVIFLFTHMTAADLEAEPCLEHRPYKTVQKELHKGGRQLCNQYKLMDVVHRVLK